MANERTLEELQNAMRAHGMWKLRLKTAISTGKCDISLDDVACDNLCDFGKWLHDETMPAAITEGMPYKVVKRLHAEFHQNAANVLKTALSGDKSQAQDLLDGPFKEQSDKLIRALTKWKGELRNL